MKKSLLLILLFCCSLLQHGIAQCDTSLYNVISIEILPDQYPTEISWDISNASGTNFGNGALSQVNTGLYTNNYCVPKTEGCLSFVVTDSFGDGIFAPGYFNVFVNGNLAGTVSGYYSQEVIYINCPPGTNCSSSAPIVEGNYTAPLADFWYAFTPDSTGMYNINTCSAACDASVWVYETCNNLIITDYIQGAYNFTNFGCDNDNASLEVLLENGHTYYIRIGDGTAIACDNQAIPWSIQYSGPITGCTDPTACNYNPLATVSNGMCTYVGDPDCVGPDLTLDSANLVTSMNLYTYVPFSNDNCAVEEGCVTGYGDREVVSFTMHIKNIGAADYYVGAPPALPSDPSTVFEFSNCHGHWHYKHYGKYTVYDKDGLEIPAGLKNGYCVIDLECSGGGSPAHSCGNMGIAAGCGDIYGSGTTCQWIDVTNLDTGRYMLVAAVNWLEQPDALGKYETTYDNNEVRVCFQLNRNEAGAASIEILGNCEPLFDCNGVLFGGAQPDCEGTCNGVKTAGDLSNNGERTNDDVVLYLEGVAANSVEAQKCTDLNDDENINVVDAALLQECVIHADEPAYWGNDFACFFPAGMYNPNQIVILNTAEVNSELHYMDVNILNPLCRVMAYETQVEGITGIDSVVNLVAGWSPLIRWGQDGKIVALHQTEQVIDKQYNPLPLFRVYYKELVAEQICLDSTKTTFVNQKYEEVDRLVGINCQTSVGTNNVIYNDGLTAIPNPFEKQVKIFFANPNQQTFQLEFINSVGQVVRNYKNLQGNEVNIDRADLPAGLYIARIVCEGRSYTTSILAQ